MRVIKTITQNYDPIAGVAYTKVEFLGKEFTGTAKVHPEDKEFATEQRGFAISEVRAKLSALKYEYSLERKKFDELFNFVTAVTQYKNFDPDSPTAKAMFRQLNRRAREVDILADDIVWVEDYLNDYVNQLDKINR